MQAGKLRHRIKLQTKSVTRDSFGGEVITWSDVITVWAELEPWHLKHAISLRRQQGEAVVGFRVRSTLNVSLADRLFFDSKGYSIVDIDVTRKHKGELFIMATAEDNDP